MADNESFLDESNAGAYKLFFGAMVLFVITSAVLQSVLSLHWMAVGAQIVAILGSALIYRAIASDSVPDWPAFDRLGAGPLALAVLAVACISVAFTANVSISLLVELVPALREFAEEYKKLIERLIIDTTGWTKVLAIVSVSVVAPICEESLFRGTMLQEQRKVESFGVAIVINGLLFSIFHLNPVGFVSLWLVGAFFAHLALSSGTMWVPILAHAFFNLFNSTILPAVAPGIEDVETKYGASELGLALVVLVPITAGLWALTTYLIERDRPPGEFGDTG